MIEDDKDYIDIIDLPHHTSTKRARMPMANRAAQFAPFAALTGYDALVRETARLTSNKILLDDTEKYILNEKLRIILENKEIESTVTITYFVADNKKEGGQYEYITGVIKCIDTIERRVIFTDKSSVYIEDILNIEGDILNNIDF